MIGRPSDAPADAGEGMAQVMQPHALQSRRLRERSPRLLQVRAGLAVLCASDDMRVALARKRRKDRKRRRREIGGLPSGLAVWQEQKPSFEVHVIPSG